MSDARKNIILFSFDDAVTFYHYGKIFKEPLRIPNLDAFCRKSTVFNMAYCQSPICGPSRASLMSARTPHQLGVFQNDDSVFDRIDARDMWPYLLKQNGYYCSSGGKVHHYYRPLRRRHHQVLYSDAQKRWRADMRLPATVEKRAYGGHRRGYGTTDQAYDSEYYDHKSADSAIAFLESYDEDAPFYREIGFYSPHGPHYTPARFKEMYDRRAFTKPAEWAAGYDETDYAAGRYPANIAGYPDRWWQMSVRNYYSALSHGDYHFGRIMSALAKSRHAENTVVIVLSDHGFHLGNRDRFKKTTMWEQVANVPLLIFDPSQPKGQEVDDPVALLDIGKTVLDYAGVEPGAHHMGQSLRGLVQGERGDDRAIPTFHHGDVSARVGPFRIIRYSDGSTEFFDITKDPWQLKNLGTSHPQFRASYARLIEAARSHGLDPESGEAIAAQSA